MFWKRIDNLLSMIGGFQKENTGKYFYGINIHAKIADGPIKSGIDPILVTLKFIMFDGMLIRERILPIILSLSVQFVMISGIVTILRETIHQIRIVCSALLPLLKEEGQHFQFGGLCQFLSPRTENHQGIPSAVRLPYE